jgi:hypothetical protein
MLFADLHPGFPFLDRARLRSRVAHCRFKAVAEPCAAGSMCSPQCGSVSRALVCWKNGDVGPSSPGSPNLPARSPGLVPSASLPHVPLRRGFLCGSVVPGPQQQPGCLHFAMRFLPFSSVLVFSFDFFRCYCVGGQRALCQISIASAKRRGAKTRHAPLTMVHRPSS